MIYLIMVQVYHQIKLIFILVVFLNFLQVEKMIKMLVEII